jgi:hypothetical protein
MFRLISKALLKNNESSSSIGTIPLFFAILFSMSVIISSKMPYKFRYVFSLSIEIMYAHVARQGSNF